jgi:Uma2 family endonuclease
MSQITLEKRRSRSRDGYVSYAEFLASSHENAHVEWVDGRIEAMVPISDAHDELTGLLAPILRWYVKEKNLGIVRQDPFQMKTGPDLPGRAPDILFVSNAHKTRMKRTHVNGPADLVVEVISTESRGRDRGEKFFEYEKGGVPEYWLLDPQRKQAEFYLLKKRIYRLADLDAKGVFHSVALPGVWIDPRWLWNHPLPSGLSILRQWGMIQ